MFTFDSNFGKRTFEKSKLYDNKNYFVNRLIGKGQAEIFIPNKGDIYFLTTDIIHKTNPLAGNDHLCLRIYLKRKSK